ncbi:MAG: hypothetical protein ACMVY4_08130 [Minwuia sp.]|uniref:hypothetical protein n=1 Tax=Minwuia sp. TaxID=2493630 RepID=UPI003A8C8848
MRAACRTSAAPLGRKSGASCPFPKRSAADASQRIGQHLIAQEKDGDEQHHDRGAHHAEDEDVEGQRVEPLVPCRQADDAFGQLNGDDELARLALGVDGEGPPEPARQVARQHAVFQRELPFVEIRPRDGVLQMCAGIELDVEAEMAARGVEQPLPLLRIRIQPHLVDDHGDLAGHAEGHVGRDRAPVPFVEDPGHHALQHDHRRDDDQQRAREKLLRHVAPEQGVEWQRDAHGVSPTASRAARSPRRGS